MIRHALRLDLTRARIFPQHGYLVGSLPHLARVSRDVRQYDQPKKTLWYCLARTTR